MKIFFKIKKNKFIVFLLLFFNQFLLNAHAINSKKIDLGKSGKYKLERKFYYQTNSLISKENKDQINQTKIEAKEIEAFSKEIDDFLEETFDKNDFEDFKNQKNKPPQANDNVNELDKKSTNKDNGKSNTNKKIKQNNNPQEKEDLIKNNNLIKKFENELLLPSRSVISSSEFKVPSRGYIKLNGPDITLNLQKVDYIESLKLIAKLGEYGIIFIADSNTNQGKNLNQPKITANFENADISDVFNSILLSANLQAVVENNIIYVGKNILNKSLKPKVSKTFRLNQVNAASVADYLQSLGAQISKVSVISGSNGGSEISDSFLNIREFKDEPINSYGIEGGPLFGLVGTADLRLQTVTLIGSKEIIQTAEKFIKQLDIRHKQVALTIKIIDVSLTKNDIKNNVFELRKGNTRIVSNSGFGLRTGNFDSGNPTTTSVPNIITGGVAPDKFLNWLEAKITNENAKILASPTLILGENPNVVVSGSSTIDDELAQANIGRPFKNEGFIKVGETVVTGFTQTNNEGVTTCTAEKGTAGITFGAKVDKIDDNGFVTFVLSPAISSVTKSEAIANCGIQNTLSVRKLDTGSIRVKNNDTLILTGVLQDSDSVTTNKVPILGDVPILGSLFRSNATLKRKSELIILVTPRILKDK